MAHRKKKNSKGVYSIIFIVLILFITVSIKSVELNQKKDTYLKQTTKLEEQIKEAEKTQKSLAEQEAYMKTDKYIKSIAKEKLNLVEKNEIVFKAKE